MKNLTNTVNLIVDLHAFAGALTGKHHYTLGLLEAISRHELARNIHFHLVSTTPLRNMKLANSSEYVFPKPWYYLKLSRLTRTLPSARLLSPTSFVPPLVSFCPSITIVYDTASLTPQPFARNTKARILEPLLFHPVLARSQTILTISESVALELSLLTPQSAAKIMVIYPQLRPFPQPDPAILKTHQLPPHGYLLFVGTLEPRKNIINLLKGYHQFLRQVANNNPPKLVLAGQKGWQAQPMFNAIQTLKLTNHVIVIDSPNDQQLATLYANCLFFCFVSLYEGFGMPVLEAMSFGKAVLASDIPVLNEVTGNCSLSVDPHDPSAITQAMIKLSLDTPFRLERQKHTTQQIKKLKSLKQIDHFMNKL